jgi:diguanylate cyclase (GGDEF)-like protein
VVRLPEAVRPWLVVVLSATLVAVCTVVVVLSQRLGDRIALVRDASLDQDAFQLLEARAAEEQLALARFRLDRDPADLAEFRAAAADVDVLLADATARDTGPDVESDGTDDVAELRELTDLHGTYRARAEELIGDLAAGAAPDPGTAGAVDAVEETFLGRLDAVEADHAPATDAALLSARDDGHRVQAGAPAAMVLVLVLLGGLWRVDRSRRRALEHHTLHDSLTGLPNRALFEDRVGQALALAARTADGPAVLELDLHGFKEVNDALGHRAGDELLLELAGRLRPLMRAGDTLARFGGDRFAVLLPAGGADAGSEVARRMLAAIEEPFVVAGVSVGIEASIGIATHDGGLPGDDPRGDGTADLLRCADTALHVARDERAGFSHYAGDGGHDDAAERIGLLGALREALERDQLVVHYQPQVSARSGRLVGVEALVRWQHPELGLLPPGRFVPIAESTTLIHRLTDVVLEKALRDGRAWLDAGLETRISVNVSARALLDRDLAAHVAERLAGSGFPARLLTLEITESAVMADPERAVRTLESLRGMGIRLSVDDFGTGYSSMAYLRQLPIGELKVDRSFVSRLTDAEDVVLVRTAIDLGHNLGLSVVAEGVEDAETCDILSSLGADELQGYFLGRPMPAADLTSWLTSRGVTKAAAPAE